jgi:hypothetical protein
MAKAKAPEHAETMPESCPEDAEERLRRAEEGRQRYEIAVSETDKAFEDNKLGLKSVLRDMQIAYSTSAPTGVRETINIRRWRLLYRDKPEKFLAIMESHEEKAEAKKRSVKAKAAELERLREAESKLKAELTAAREKWEAELRVLRERVQELEALVPGDVLDEYENPALERLEALKERLIREACREGVSS